MKMVNCLKPTEKSKVCIIVLNYNDSITTKKMIKTIERYPALSNIVVVDNYSTDDSYISLKKLESEKIDIIKSDYNGGYAYGNNYGIQYTINKYDCNYFIVSNPDVYFENDIVKKMLDFFETHIDAGIVAPQMKSSKKVTYYNYDFKECIASLFLIVSKIKRKYTKSKTGKVNFYPGSFYMISKDAYSTINGFDNNTFLYCEEIITNKRLEKKGYNSYILKNVFYEHNHSVTVDKVLKSKTKPFKIYTESLYYYLVNYLNINLLQKMLFKICKSIAYCERIIYDFIERQRKC